MPFGEEEKEEKVLRQAWQLVWQASFLRFAFVGAIATSLQFVVLVLGIEWLNFVPVVASSLGYAISAVCNYLMNYYFTFGGGVSHLEAVPKFFIVVLVGLSVNAFIFYMITRVLPLYLFAQAVAIAGAMVVNFLMHRYWIYRR